MASSTASSSYYPTPTGTYRLSRDMATLVNNRQGSDIQFKVGRDLPTITTIYAHSIILRCRSRYFAAMLDEDKRWKESSNAVIYKPNVSPSTFEDVFYYIYTGNVRVTKFEKIVELITAADEMDLEELKIDCQDKLIRHVKFYMTSSKSDNLLPTVYHMIIPALELVNSPSFSHLSKELLAVMLPNMSVIINSPDVYTVFTKGISSEALTKIIASDDLIMMERNVWDLALSWACHQMNISKTAVETRLINYEDEEDKNDNAGDLEERTLEKLGQHIVLNTHLEQLKVILAPLLPFIRFSLLESEDYTRMVDTLSYFLPRRRSSELQRFFINPRLGTLDTPRKKLEKRAREGDTGRSIFLKRYRTSLSPPSP